MLWADAARATNPRARRGRKRGNHTEEMEEQERVRRNAEHARTKAGKGHMTRTIQALTSSGLANHSAATLRVLREKHPEPLHPMGPPLTTDHAPLTIPQEDVLKAITRFPRGTAPGPLGLQPEHLRAAITSNATTRRAPTLAALTKLVNKMLAGAFLATVASYLATGCLHAAKNKDGGCSR